MSARNTAISTIDICDQWFQNFYNNAFEIWAIVGLTAILCLSQRENPAFL